MPGTKVDAYGGAPFDLEALLERLREAKVLADAPMGFTRRDLQKALGVRQARASEILRDLYDVGLIELVGKRPMAAVDGGIRLIPVYRIIKK